MPLVFEKEGFRFAFYSNDHRPIYVHVRKGGGEAIFNVEDAVELRESVGLKVRELARAEELAEETQAGGLPKAGKDRSLGTLGKEYDRP